jgi:hypothetical protein
MTRALFQTAKLRSRALMVDGRAFVLVVVVGGLLALESSSALDAPKFVYLLLAAVAAAGAIASARWWLTRQRSAMAEPWLIVSGAFAVLALASVAVSIAHGTSLTSWLRDVSSYGLFAAAPIVALACARSASRRWIIVVFAICGAFASVSFAVEWLGRRSIAQLPIDRIVLPSGSLACGLLALASAFAITAASRRRWWSAAAGVVLGLFFVTGTRSTLLFIAVPIGVSLVAGRPWRRGVRTVLTSGMVAVAIFITAEVGIAVAYGGFPSLGSATATASPSPNAAYQPSPTATPNTELTTRLNGVGRLLVDPGSDPSFQSRWLQTGVAWQAFLTSPLVGVGPGYGFVWTDTPGGTHDEFTLDTPLVYLAKFGLLGLIPLALFVAAYVRLAVALRRRGLRAQSEYSVMIGYGITLVIAEALGAPIEEKGTSFALIFVVALGVHALVRQAPASEIAEAPLRIGEPEGTSAGLSSP